MGERIMKKIIISFLILVAGLQLNVNCSLAKTASQSMVIDCYGNKTPMKKLNLNLKKKYANFDDADITIGAVASDGNFYIAKEMKKGVCKIYKNGKVCKTFQINDKKSWIRSMVRMGDKYYAFIQSNGSEQLIKLMDGKKGFEVLKKDVRLKDMYVLNNTFMSIHTDANNSMLWATISKGETLYTGEHVSYTKQMSKNRVHVTRINNTMYYGISQGKKIKIYKFNVKSRKERLIVEYKKKRKSNDDTIINFDESYMYCQGDIIPLKGGKIISVSKKNYTAFSSNKKYIYYIDKKRRLHKINKKTLKDTFAVNMKVRDVYATDKGVFFRKYDKDLEREMWADADEREDDKDNNLHRYFPRHIYKLTKNGKAKVILK